MNKQAEARTPWLRWHILKTLLHKEVLRHLANRGGIALVLLLIVASLLLSLTGGEESQGASGGFGGVKRCYIDYWERDAWVEHLMANTPKDLESQIRFRNVRRAPTNADGTILYAQNTGGIQIRPNPEKSPRYLVWVWHPGADGSALAPFEAWFWRETQVFTLAQTAPALTHLSPDARRSITTPDSVLTRSQLKGGLDPRSGIATSLVIFGMFFVCIYLLPSLSCEERERGVLLAQALSPASPREILAAKFLFYPLLGILLAAVLAGAYNPRVLIEPFFWLTLLVGVCGSMGVGLTIASLARTQRAASLGAMCYMLGISVVLVICQQNGVPFLPYLALEYHCPRIIHAVLGDAVQWYHWAHLAGAAVLACVWAVVATVLFRRYGWQT
jgi:ABC-2 family transporter protein